MKMGMGALCHCANCKQLHMNSLSTDARYQTACRRMSCPVYEEEHLPHFPGARACARLPLPPPTRPAGHQVSKHTPYISCLCDRHKGLLVFGAHQTDVAMLCLCWVACRSLGRVRMRLEPGCREQSAHRLIVSLCGAPVSCCDY